MAFLKFSRFAWYSISKKLLATTRGFFRCRLLIIFALSQTMFPFSSITERNRFSRRLLSPIIVLASVHHFLIIVAFNSYILRQRYVEIRLVQAHLVDNMRDLAKFNGLI